MIFSKFDQICRFDKDNCVAEVVSVQATERFPEQERGHVVWRRSKYNFKRKQFQP